MTPQELEKWLKKHGLKEGDFAELIGVTYPAVQHWTNGRRSVSLTVTRLLRLFDRDPSLMRGFAK